MAKLLAGMVMPPRETGLWAGLPPNQGVLSLPHPVSSGLPAMESILLVSSVSGTRTSSADLAAGPDSGIII